MLLSRAERFTDLETVAHCPLMPQGRLGSKQIAGLAVYSKISCKVADLCPVMRQFKSGAARFQQDAFGIRCSLQVLDAFSQVVQALRGLTEVCRLSSLGAPET